MLIPDLQASIICDDIRREANGKMIIIGSFDSINVRSLPTITPRICIFNRWCCGSGSFKQQTRIIMPDGITEFTKGKEVDINLPSQEAFATSIECFLNLKFNEAGTYWIEITLNGDLKIRYPLTVNLQTQP